MDWQWLNKITNDSHAYQIKSNLNLVLCDWIFNKRFSREFENSNHSMFQSNTFGGGGPLFGRWQLNWYKIKNLSIDYQLYNPFLAFFLWSSFFFFNIKVFSFIFKNPLDIIKTILLIFGISNTWFILNRIGHFLILLSKYVSKIFLKICSHKQAML